MGEHIPLCLLAGVGAVYVVRRWLPRPHSKPSRWPCSCWRRSPPTPCSCGATSTTWRTTTARRAYCPTSRTRCMTPTAGSAQSRRPPGRRAGLPDGLRPAARRDRPRGLVRPLGRDAGLRQLKLESVQRFSDAASADDGRTDAALPRPPSRRLICFTLAMFPSKATWTRRNQYHPFADFAHHPPPDLRPVYANADFTVSTLSSAASPRADTEDDSPDPDFMSPVPQRPSVRRRPVAGRREYWAASSPPPPSPGRYRKTTQAGRVLRRLEEKERGLCPCCQPSSALPTA